MLITIEIKNDDTLKPIKSDLIESIAECDSCSDIMFMFHYMDMVKGQTKNK